MKSRVFAEFESYDSAEYAAAVVKNRIDINRITVSGGKAESDPTGTFSAVPVFSSAASAVGVVTSPEFFNGEPAEKKGSVYVCVKADDGQAKRAASMFRSMGALSVKVMQVPM